MCAGGVWLAARVDVVRGRQAPGPLLRRAPGRRRHAAVARGGAGPPLRCRLPDARRGGVGWVCRAGHPIQHVRSGSLGPGQVHAGNCRYHGDFHDALGRSHDGSHWLGRVEPADISLVEVCPRIRGAWRLGSGDALYADRNTGCELLRSCDPVRQCVDGYGYCIEAFLLSHPLGLRALRPRLGGGVPNLPGVETRGREVRGAAEQSCACLPCGIANGAGRLAVLHAVDAQLQWPDGQCHPLPVRRAVPAGLSLECPGECAGVAFQPGGGRGWRVHRHGHHCREHCRRPCSQCGVVLVRGCPVAHAWPRPLPVGDEFHTLVA
mmetsp:Transcript_110718/g.352664  ORF Transcript_110718/g.352664 Transcript_110718/m.352664 type:complete len:321 (-) Transcript_110718:648-1610(-)